MPLPPRFRHAAVLLVAGVGIVAACTGPGLHLHNPAGHTTFVDGGRTGSGDISLPFRYYGTTRWDALPADRADGEPDWSTLPGSGLVEVPAPAPAWIFPLDLPVELLRAVAAGTNDVEATIALEPVPPALVVHDGVPPAGLSEASQRARAARAAR